MADQDQTPTPTPNRAPEGDVDRDAILAEMASAAGPRGAPAPQPDPAPEVTEEAEPAESEEASDEEPAEAEPAPAPEKKAEAKPDEDARLLAMQKAEKAAKVERMAAAEERAKLATERKEKAETEKRLGAFEKALAKAKTDPGGVLELLGVPAERYEDLANYFYARSEKGKADPRYKDVSERAMRERETRDGIEELRAELTALKTQAAEREARIEAERVAERHMTGVFKSARSTKDAPLLARLFAKDAEKAERKLASIALELANESGELPDAEDIITTYEKRRRAELEDDGVDVDAMLKTAPPKPQSKTAGEKPTARTLNNEPSTSTQVRRSDLSEQEEREQILAEIAKMNRGPGADARS